MLPLLMHKFLESSHCLLSTVTSMSSSQVNSVDMTYLMILRKTGCCLHANQAMAVIKLEPPVLVFLLLENFSLDYERTMGSGEL